MMEPKYTDVTVQLTGRDGNAFSILGAVRKALRRAGHEDAADDFFKEATTGDYNHLLQTAMKFVNVE